MGCGLDVVLICCHAIMLAKSNIVQAPSMILFLRPKMLAARRPQNAPAAVSKRPGSKKKGKALRGQLVGSLVSQSVSQSALIALRSVISVELLDQVDETDMWGGRKLTRRFFSQKRTPLEIPPSRSTSRRRYTPVSCS